MWWCPSSYSGCIISVVASDLLIPHARPLFVYLPVFSSIVLTLSRRLSHSLFFFSKIIPLLFLSSCSLFHLFRTVCEADLSLLICSLSHISPTGLFDLYTRAGLYIASSFLPEILFGYHGYSA